MNKKLNIEKAAYSIIDSDAILINAGAGIGVDSGLPDFRGTSGFWKAYPLIEKLGISFSEMANPRWFDENPKLAWAFYGHRLNLYRETTPHKGFDILLDLGNKKEGGYFVFTSNVDGQFQKAGFNPDFIEECHGSINHFQCSEPCSYSIWNAKDEIINVNLEIFEASEPLPRCPKCNAIARPNILMFGDWSWISNRTNFQSEKLIEWLDNNYNYGFKTVVIELGAGTSVPTVRYKSESIANKYNASLIRINPRDYSVPSKQISIPMGAAEGIQKIMDKITEINNS